MCFQAWPLSDFFFKVKRLEDTIEFLLAKFFHSWEAQNQQEKQTANFQQVSENPVLTNLNSSLLSWKGDLICALLTENFSCRPSPEEALLWSEGFEELLASKYGVAVFRAFLKSQFCEENIDFWLACEDFKKIKSSQKLSSKAKEIYIEFIEKDAPKEVNIDFQTKILIVQNIQNATTGCFTSAQKRVYSLMENNSYPHFLASEFYQNLCKKPQITTEHHAI
uniref:RGS domain-containing protein n=1 Tax=Oryctolagus cuniculus TaxID=9986 RepID=G1SX61_RABIT